MQRILIVDGDLTSRKQLADLFIEAGYNVTVTNSTANALYGILKKTAQVVLLSWKFDEVTASKLIPLLRKCNRELSIILITENMPLSLIRRIRREGIFYHALKPVSQEDMEEIRQVVQCAMDMPLPRTFKVEAG